MTLQDLFSNAAFQFVVCLVVFLVLARVGKWLYVKIKSNSRLKNSKLFNLDEYLPEEEATTIKQVFYLIMIIIFVANIIYVIFEWRMESINLVLLDLAISLYVVINGDIDFSNHKILFFLLIPFASISYLLFESSSIDLLDLIHVFAFPYLIKLYYKKFVDYTETNSLGITIMLLFLIIFISFLVTIPVEGVSPLDSLVMVSNAFTSNGYAVLGHTAFGKINAIILVWSGFILSGVGTATLAVAIVMKYANERFDYLEEMLRKNNRKK